MAEKVLIIGSGPAGFTAAIYAARAELQPFMFEGFSSGGSPGGQLMTTTEVENYPGFPGGGIGGPDLMDKFRNQAIEFGTTAIMEDVIEVDLSSRPFKVKTTSQEKEAHALIIATGATAKRLWLPGEIDGGLWTNGISACAVCDGALPPYRNKELVVVGGGDTACEEALFLTKYASKVYLVHRRDSLRASKIMAERAMNHEKMEILWDTVVEDALGDGWLSGVRLRNVKTDEVRDMECGGLFYGIGHTPNTAFLSDQLDLDETGYIKVKPGTSYTSVEGVFAAGDVHDKVYRQAITAAGSGCMAALDAERWLAEQGIE